MKTDAEILDHFVGKEGSDLRAFADNTMIEYAGRTPMGCVLFQKHTHAELCDPEEIVYKEKDVIELLEFLGYPVKFGDE